MEEEMVKDVFGRFGLTSIVSRVREEPSPDAWKMEEERDSVRRKDM